MWRMANGFLAAAIFVSTICHWPFAAFAEPSSDYILQMARVDLLIRKRQFTQAADDLGRVSKEHQEEALFQEYTQKVTSALYAPKERAAAAPKAALARRDTVTERLRVTRRKKDADARSDQNSDGKGWQVNQHLESDVEGQEGIRAKFALDLDGFKDGHNDLRYRTVLADFYDGPSHWGLGDTATYPSPYFLRGSRLRGVNMILSGELNEFQAVAGGYPVWLENRDEYIYPRTVLGARDRWKIFDDRIRLGAGFVNTQDSGRIRMIDTANNVRENSVYSLDQEVKLIPDVWYLKTAQAYSATDDNLEENRFGENTELKDTSFKAETLLIQPWMRWTGRFERTGPDFRLLTDFPQGPVNFPKQITADRQLFENFVDLEPIGPFDLDLQASLNRNDLDRDATVEATRQSWYSANLGIRTPKNWPKPRVRATMIDTVSSPGTQVRPGQSREVNLRSELSHTHGGIHFTEFAEYETDRPVKDKALFSAEEKWSLGARASMTLLERILVSPHYTYRFTDTTEVLFKDNAHRVAPVDAVNHEAGLSTSTRLWSTASLGLTYTFLHGKLTDPGGLLLTPTQGHSGAVNFSWPTTRHSWNKRRKLTLFPVLGAQFTDLSRPAEKRPILSSRLSLTYEAMQDWKAELKGEFLFDHDTNGDRIWTQEQRVWMLWTKQWQDGQAPSTPWVWAAEDQMRRNELEFGPEFYYYHYEEPSLGVTFYGPMVGLAASFTHHHPNHLMLKAESRGAAGRVDYTGSGKISGISDYTFEGRLTTGYDVPLKDDRLLTPFFGIGYRYLNDGFSGKISSTNAAGYERESSYLYSPLGASYGAGLGDGWKIGLSLEYDIFWKGIQRSHLEDVNPDFDTLSNDQTRGYGTRGSVKLLKAGELLDWLIEPYLRWWNIQDSEIVGTGFEPENETLEVGGNIRVRF